MENPIFLSSFTNESIRAHCEFWLYALLLFVSFILSPADFDPLPKTADRAEKAQGIS
jgi:hypothetical protein